MANEPKITNDTVVECLRVQASDRRRGIEQMSKEIKAALVRFDSAFQSTYSLLSIEESRSIRMNVDILVRLCEELREQARIETLFVAAGVLAQRS